ncbi:hypothetical protein [Caulobacter sp. 602-1]|uniref:hypothetical protein n=1 Tax=Caulobacter sp. 602-1 TaxID=2492472 RepID=UPI000F6360CE|nr:hypothetical protein [Caulobacter sp. 602-1]RRN64670.1 hypothetical protein EIK80_11585 [Caulobacter sp. 602-1]
MAGTISPKRVLAEGLEPRRTRNLFPATYERDASIVAAMLARNEAQAATARRVLQAALKSGDKVVARSQRRQLDRFETYSRNCRERLNRLARPATPVVADDLAPFLMAA